MKEKRRTRVVVVIPAYNEQKTISQVITAVPRDAASEVLVLVVDDGSQDSTVENAKNAGADEIMSFTQNEGLGYAFREGVQKALELGADYVVNIDADMQFDPGDIPKLLRPLFEKKADVVVCSRFLDKSIEPRMPWIKSVGNKAFSKLISKITRVHLTDTQCGFRAYTREAALRMNIFSRYTYTQESLIDLIEKGMKVVEVACKVRGSREGKSKVVDNAFSYALRSFGILIRTVRDYRALEFFGGIGFAVFSLGAVSGLAMFIRWLYVGRNMGYQNVITGSVFLLMLGFLLIILALQSEMNSRNRKILEQILYLEKKREI